MILVEKGGKNHGGVRNEFVYRILKTVRHRLSRHKKLIFLNTGQTAANTCLSMIICGTIYDGILVFIRALLTKTSL